MKKTTFTLLSMALVFSSFGALSAHAESLQGEKTKSHKMLKQKHQKKFLSL